MLWRCGARERHAARTKNYGKHARLGAKCLATLDFQQIVYNFFLPLQSAGGRLANFLDVVGLTAARQALSILHFLVHMPTADTCLRGFSSVPFAERSARENAYLRAVHKAPEESSCTWAGYLC
eukprot:2565410-Pleurochrysis_carterae.AAC.1